MDFVDFFHSVSNHKVYEVFSSDFFSFDNEATDLLTRLCTYQGRLPMGSPTSPVLSNFSTIGMDADLWGMVQNWGVTYTRFADDLSFSSNTTIEAHQIAEIKAMAHVNGFVFNEQKYRLCTPSAEKTVTGLIVGEKEVSLPNDYFNQLNEAYKKLTTVLEVQYQTGKTQSKWVEKYKEQIEGHLRFAEFVVGADDAQYRVALANFDNIKEPTGDYDTVNWLSFNYINF